MFCSAAALFLVTAVIFSLPEEEKKYGHASPQFEDDLLDSQFNEVFDVRDASSSPLGAVPLESNSACGDNSFVQDSSKGTFPCEDKLTALPTTSSSHTTNEVNFTVEHKGTNGTCKQDLVTDLQCGVCKQLLFRPVVLNCGHVYCEGCVNALHDSVCKCPVCQSPHPNGFPNVCLVLEHFLEEHLPEEYSARKESSANVQNVSLSGSSTEKQEQAAKHSSVAKNIYSSWWSGHGAKVHPGVGCDYCGMCPIIGDRYKCKDCVEKIGFDLCDKCYNSSSKLPGRFNQQHTQEHQFEVVRPPFLRNLILSLGAEPSDEYGVRIVNPDNPEEVLTLADMSNDASEDELENAASINSLDNDPQDGEAAMGSPNSMNNGSRDHGQ